mmetsp:Transcript_17595/g.26561  ORF Transcript_17595/g.26561 Transcript_17595/m.26561 type:complete len:288 (-) Transcript_17595:121-984(-)
MESWKSAFRANLFDGKVAIVTGGGTGLGLAITEELCSLGCTVIIGARKLERCEEAAQKLNSEGHPGTVVPYAMDLRDEASVNNLMKFVVERFGKIDFLVNNAGGQFLKSAEEISANGFRAVVDTNLTGTFLACHAAYHAWMKDHGGAIVNIIMSMRNGFPMMAHSGAARAGVENLTRSLALEWVNAGVRLNCVSPGIIYTESGFANYGPVAEKLLPQLMKAIPAKRLGTPQETAGAAVFLLSPAAAYITGTTVDVDGGLGMSYLPLVRIKNKNRLGVYGTLPPKAKL